MRQRIKKIIPLLVLLIIITSLASPSVAMASWWNPLTWKIFNRTTETKVERAIVPPAPQNTTQQKPSDQSSEVEKLKKQVEELKKKSTSVSPTLKQPIPTVIQKSNPQPTPAKITPPPIETWAELEAKYFVSADQKGWTSQTITNALGEKKYYRKEGNLWVRKNSEAEIQQPYVAPPTSQQLTNLRRFCLSDSFINSVCNDQNFTPGYYSNLKFREGIDSLIVKYNAIISDQQKQKIAAENKTIDCIMAPTPENERLMDPATQNYLRQLRCGTVTGADRTNYELSRIKSSVDELKYRLDQKISFPPLYLDPIKAPTFTNPQWQIRWEGSGGTITDSNGGFYQFHCEYNTCRSY